MPTRYMVAHRQSSKMVFCEELQIIVNVDKKPDRVYISERRW